MILNLHGNLDQKLSTNLQFYIPSLSLDNTKLYEIGLIHLNFKLKDKSIIKGRNDLWMVTSNIIDTTLCNPRGSLLYFALDNRLQIQNTCPNNISYFNIRHREFTYVNFHLMPCYDTLTDLFITHCFLQLNIREKTTYGRLQSISASYE